MDWRLAFEPAEVHNSNFLATVRATVTRTAKKTQLAMNGLPYEEQLFFPISQSSAIIGT